MAEFTGTVGTPSGGFTLKVVYSYTQNVTNNTSTVTATGYVKRNNSSYYPSSSYATASMSIAGNTKTLSGSVYYNLNTNDYDQIISHSYTVPHNADGTKSITITLTFDGNRTSYYPNGSVSKTITLTTIPRATTPTLDDTSYATGETVTVSMPRASSSFTHTVSIAFGNLDVTVGSSLGTSTTYTIPADWATQIPNATSGTATLTCKTYNDSTLIGTKTLNFTITIPNTVVPIISSIDISETISGLSSQFGEFIQSKSNPKVTITASGTKGSSITSYSTTFNGKIFSGSSFTLGVINSSGSLTITTTVTDSRGRTTSKSATITIVDYISPTLSSFTVSRCDSTGATNDDGTYVKIIAVGSIASCNNKNTNSYKVEYKLSSGSSWETLMTGSGYSISINSAQTIDGGFLATNTYDFKITITDYFASTASVKTVSTSFVLMNYRNTGKGIGIGKVSEKDALEVALESNFTQPVIMTNNYYAQAGYGGTSGADGYVGLIEISILGAFCDAPFVFEFNQRDLATSTQIFVRFTNTDTTDPELSSFVYMGMYGGVYISKVGTSAWRIYVKKSSGYDSVTLSRYATGTYNTDRATVTLINEFITELPDSYMEATRADTMNNVTTSTPGYALDARVGKELNDKITDYVKFVSWDDETSRTIAAHTELNTGITFPTYDGYTLLGCVGGHGNGQVGLLVSGNRWVFNTSTSSKTYASIIWYLLYVKSNN